jgi:hypothetical protein
VAAGAAVVAAAVAKRAVAAVAVVLRAAGVELWVAPQLSVAGCLAQAKGEAAAARTEVAAAAGAAAAPRSPPIRYGRGLLYLVHAWKKRYFGL